MTMENKVWAKYSIILGLASTIGLRVGERYFDASPITASSITLGIAVGLIGMALREQKQKLNASEP